MKAFGFFLLMVWCLFNSTLAGILNLMIGGLIALLLFARRS